MLSTSKLLLLLYTLQVLCYPVSSINESSTTTLEGRLVYPNQAKTPFNVTTQITLNSGEFTTYSRTDGSFSFFHVGPGVHQLDIHNTEYMFGQVKIQLLEDSMDVPKCIEYAYPGATKMATKYPLELSPHAKYQFFEKKRGFSIFGLLKNPMALMMLLSVGLMFALPKMMENLEPEEKAAMKKQMEAQQNPTQMLTDMWGELSGGAGGAGGAGGSKDAVSARRAARRQKRSSNKIGK